MKQQKIPEIISSEKHPKLFISDNVLKKIQYLCRAIPDVEWSGILLYKVEGSMRDIENVTFILKDIIPMNKGSKTYTEYKYNSNEQGSVDDKMIDYFSAKPEALEEDWKIGHIHSHNSMSVFFSGTDMDELVSNSKSHNFYLSLIVNNWMDFKAKVATDATAEIKSNLIYTAADENGEFYPIVDENVNEIYRKVVVYDCDIENIDLDIIVDDQMFKDFVSSIKKEKEVKKDFAKTTTKNHKYSYFRSPFMGGFDDFQDSYWHIEKTTNKTVTDVAKDILYDFFLEIFDNNSEEFGINSEDYDVITENLETCVHYLSISPTLTFPTYTAIVKKNLSILARAVMETESSDKISSSVLLTEIGKILRSIDPHSTMVGWTASVFDKLKATIKNGNKQTIR